MMTTTTTTTATTGCPCGSVRVTSVTQCLGIHQLHYLPSAPPLFLQPYNNLLKMCVMCIIRASSRVTAESSKNHILPITSQKYRELTYKTVVKELLSKGGKKNLLVVSI